MLCPVLVVHRCVDKLVEEDLSLPLEGELLEKIDPIGLGVPAPIGGRLSELSITDLPHLSRSNLVDVDNRDPEVDLLGKPSGH